MITTNVTGPDAFLYLDLDKISNVELCKLIRENYNLSISDSLRMGKLMKQMFFCRKDSPYFYEDFDLKPALFGVNLENENIVSLTRCLFNEFNKTKNPLNHYQSKHCAQMVLDAFNAGKIRAQVVNNCK